MRGGTRTRDYRKLAAGIGFSAILLVGLAGASRWHRAAKAAAISPPESALVPSARTALKSASQRSKVKTQKSKLKAPVGTGSPAPFETGRSARPSPRALPPYHPPTPGLDFESYHDSPSGRDADGKGGGPRYGL